MTAQESVEPPLTALTGGDRGYHYLGSAIWFTRIGHAMGEAMTGLAVICTVIGTRWSIWIYGHGGRGNTLIDAALLRKGEPVRSMHLAGAGDMVTMLIQRELDLPPAQESEVAEQINARLECYRQRRPWIEATPPAKDSP